MITQFTLRAKCSACTGTGEFWSTDPAIDLIDLKETDCPIAECSGTLVWEEG